MPPPLWGAAGEDGACHPAGFLQAGSPVPVVPSRLPFGRSQHEPYVNLFSDVYRLQIALVTWLNPSLGLFDFICTVIFIRWPGSLFPACSFCCLCGIVVRRLRQTRTLWALSFTGPMPLLRLFYFPQQHSQTSKSQSMFPFSVSHSEWMLAMHPLHGMGKQCCISIGHNSALTMPRRAQPSSSANFVVRFSMCGRSLTLLQLPQLINTPTLVITDARSCGER